MGNPDDLVSAIELLLKDRYEKVVLGEKVNGISEISKKLSQDLSNGLAGYLIIEFKKDIDKKKFELGKEEYFLEGQTGILIKDDFIPDSYSIEKPSDISSGTKSLLSISEKKMWCFIKCKDNGTNLYIEERTLELIKDYYSKI